MPDTDCLYDVAGVGRVSFTENLTHILTQTQQIAKYMPLNEELQNANLTLLFTATPVERGCQWAKEGEFLPQN